MLPKEEKMLFNLGLVLVFGTSTLFTIFTLSGYTIGTWVIIPFLIGLSLCLIARIKNPPNSTKGEV